MAEDLRKLIKIAAIHHVPGPKSVTQIMKAEVFDLRRGGALRGAKPIPHARGVFVFINLKLPNDSYSGGIRPNLSRRVLVLRMVST